MGKHINTLLLCQILPRFLLANKTKWIPEMLRTGSKNSAQTQFVPSKNPQLVVNQNQRDPLTTQLLGCKMCHTSDPNPKKNAKKYSPSSDWSHSQRSSQLSSQAVSHLPCSGWIVIQRSTVQEQLGDQQPKGKASTHLLAWPMKIDRTMCHTPQKNFKNVSNVWWDVVSQQNACASWFKRTRTWFERTLIRCIA